MNNDFQTLPTSRRMLQILLFKLCERIVSLINELSFQAYRWFVGKFGSSASCRDLFK